MKTQFQLKCLVPFFAAVCCLPVISPLQAGFSSIYAFGDGVCTTTSSPVPANSYHEGRFCNGRVWIEVISQWQGLAYNATKNLSYYGHNANQLKANTANFTAPADAASSLFIVWCSNADFIGFTEDISLPYNDLSPWTSGISQAIADHVTAISTLYDKGARIIVMPTAVDVMQTPYFNNFDLTNKSFVRDRVIDYNAQMAAAMSSLAATKPGLVIHRPDVFTFLEQVIAAPAAYGMINPESFNAGAFDSGDPNLDGVGADWVFWDDFHPTAKFQMHLASFIQQQVTPVKITGLSFSGDSGQLTVANIPLGRAGIIQGSATLQPGSWVQDNTINEPSPGGSQTRTFTVPDIGPRRFYRVNFPVVWTWP